MWEQLSSNLKVNVIFCSFLSLSPLFFLWYWDFMHSKQASFSRKLLIQP